MYLFLQLLKEFSETTARRVVDKTETLVSKTQGENFIMFDLKTCQQVHQYTPQSQPVLQKQSLSVPVDTKPFLESSTLPKTLHDPCYVNVIPHSRSSPNIRSHSGALSQAVDASCTPKPPMPTPRSEKKTDGRESEGPLIIISEENEPLSVPEDVDGLKTVDSEEYGTDSSVPYDPYLKCLHCDQQFRHGEIQEYKKHVSSCAN